MQGQMTLEAARARVTTTYHKLHKTLLELVAALNVIEPGGTLLEDIVITDAKAGRIRIAYVATPIQITINTPERKLILKVIENAGEDRPI